MKTGPSGGTNANPGPRSPNEEATMSDIIPHPADDDDDPVEPTPLPGGGWLSGPMVDPPEPHPSWCDRRAGHDYHLGRREVAGEHLTTHVVVEAVTKVLVALEQYAEGCELHPEGLVSWSAAEARRVWTVLGEVLDQIEATP